MWGGMVVLQRPSHNGKLDVLINLRREGDMLCHVGGISDFLAFREGHTDRFHCSSAECRPVVPYGNDR